MPIARTLLDYLSDPFAALPKRKASSKVVREIFSILERPEREGGVTFSLYFGDQMGEPFYAVGLDNNLTRMAEPQELKEILLRFLRAHRELLAHPRCCIGVWRAADQDGLEKSWFDIAVLVYNETIAREFAREGNQIALFDLRGDSAGEIQIGGTGESMQERLQRLDRQDKPDGW